MLALMLLAPGAYGISYSINTNDAGCSASLSVPIDQELVAVTSLDGGSLSNIFSGNGDLHENHFIENDAGSIAFVSADVKKASDYKYSYVLFPGSEVQASETLDAFNADYIKAVATAAHGPSGDSQITRSSTEVTQGSLIGYTNSAVATSSWSGSSQSFDNAIGTIKVSSGSRPFLGWVWGFPSGADVSTEVSGSLGGYTSYAGSSADGLTAFQDLNSASGDIKAQTISEFIPFSNKASAGIEVNGGSLAEYYSKASASSDKLVASQNLDEASGAIKTSSKSEYIENWDTKNSNVTTSIKGELSNYDDLASSRVSGADIVEKSHIVGSFKSDAVTGDQPRTRTSNFGTEFDLIRRASLGTGSGLVGDSAKDSQGYYVSRGEKIQEAINAASSGDTINVESGTYYENLQINKPLTISGKATTTTIIDGGKNVASAIYINYPTYAQNKSCILNDLTITHGSGANGGGININNVNGSDVILKGCIISENSADLPHAVGGGIYNQGNCKLTLTDCGIFKNYADGDGGGIWSQSANLVLERCKISENRAGRNGGGIFTRNNMMLTDSQISDNKAGITEGIDWGKGGGIYNENSVLTINGDNIVQNQAMLYGGGIYNDQGTLKIYSSHIDKNKADLLGGGIHNDKGVVELNSGSISNNLAGGKGNGDGGGIYNFHYKVHLLGGIISNNRADHDGGGIYNEDGGVDGDISNVLLGKGNAPNDIHNWP